MKYIAYKYILSLVNMEKKNSSSYRKCQIKGSGTKSNVAGCKKKRCCKRFSLVPTSPQNLKGTFLTFCVLKKDKALLGLNRLRKRITQITKRQLFKKSPPKKDFVFLFFLHFHTQKRNHTHIKIITCPSTFSIDHFRIHLKIKIKTLQILILNSSF